MKYKIILMAFPVLLMGTACSSNGTSTSEVEKSKVTQPSQQEAENAVFACPMHPEVVGREGDKCVKCGMTLVAQKSENASSVEVRLSTNPTPVIAKKADVLSFDFLKDDSPIFLETSHEKKVHLIVVNEQLTWFKHLHPEQKDGSTYQLTTVFPTGGKYFLFSDFKPQGFPSIVDKKELVVEGAPMTENTSYTLQFVSKVDGYTVTLLNGNDLKTNRVQTLQFKVEKNGVVIEESDIEKHLGQRRMLP